MTMWPNVSIIYLNMNNIGNIAIQNPPVEENLSL